MDEDGLPLGYKARKASSVNQALNILHSMYAYWMTPDPATRVAYVGANPVRRLKRSSVRAQRQSERVFPIECLHAMLACAQRMEEDAQDSAQKLRAVRARWILALLFGLWGRRAEIVALRMCDIAFDGKRWSARLRRKGGAEQLLPVADWVMRACISYRESLGLSSLPTPQDTLPAICALTSPHGGEDQSKPEALKTMSPQSLYREVRWIAQAAAAALAAHEVLPDIDALCRSRAVQSLERVSPHWFRHTGASLAIESGAMSLDNASRVLGHSSSVVTAAMYYHPDEALVAEGLQKMGAMFSAPA